VESATAHLCHLSALYKDILYTVSSSPVSIAILEQIRVPNSLNYVTSEYPPRIFRGWSVSHKLVVLALVNTGFLGWDS
jgi:hypothetical protein